MNFKCFFAVRLLFFFLCDTIVGSHGVATINNFINKKTNNQRKAISVTNLSVYKQSYTDSLAYALRSVSIDFEFLKVYRKLIGLELCFGTTEYGCIVSFKETSERRDTRTYAVTNKGFEFEVEQLIDILTLIQMKSQGKQIVYPQGSDFAQRWTQPKPKRRTRLVDGSMFIHPSQFDYYTRVKRNK